MCQVIPPKCCWGAWMCTNQFDFTWNICPLAKISLSLLFSRAGEACFQIPKLSLVEPAWPPDYSSFDDLTSAFLPLFFHFNTKASGHRETSTPFKHTIQFKPHKGRIEGVKPAPRWDLKHLQKPKKRSESGVIWMTESLHPEQSHMILHAVCLFNEDIFRNLDLQFSFYSKNF